MRPRGLFALLDDVVQGADSFLLALVIGFFLVAALGVMFLLKIRRDLYRIDEARRREEEAKRREEEAKLKKMAANRRNQPSY